MSPARPQQTKGLIDDSHGDETTPTTLWHLEPVVSGSQDGREGREEKEREREGSESSSRYNELWQSSSTVETSRLTEGGEEEEGERGEEGEQERREVDERGEGEAERRGTRTSNDVDGATGQSTIARSDLGTKGV